MSYALQTVGELLSPALKCNRGPNILCQDLLVGRKELKAVAPCNDSAGWRSGKPLFRCSCNLPAYLSLAKRGSDLALAGVSHTTPAPMEDGDQQAVLCFWNKGFATGAPQDKHQTTKLVVIPPRWKIQHFVEVLYGNFPLLKLARQSPCQRWRNKICHCVLPAHVRG